MRFAEQLLLLLHSQDTGYFVPIPEWRMSCALAGAVLMDLALEDRIDSDLETLTVVDATPTGDSLLDPSLEELASEDTVHPPQYWVERLARRGDQISHEAIERLVYSTVMISFSAPHHMEEHFAEPEKVDIDHYLEPRNEHRHPGVYMPFGVGTHPLVRGQ